MALVKGKFVDKDLPIQSNNDPIDDKDLARKGYVDAKAAAEAAAAVSAIDLSAKADLVDGKVPASQLPSYVDDVLEYANLAAFPATGETGKIYVALDTGNTYRWSGSAYVEISASPGSTDAVPEGVINLYFTPERAQEALAGDLGLKQDSLGTGTTSQFLRGDLTWQEIEASASVAVENTRYVTKGGDDATADGSLTKPYLTIAAAMASITDAAPTKRYAIKVEAGAYTEGELTLKPNVFIVGDLKEAVRVTATSVAMDPSFNQPSSFDNRSGMARIILTGACNFDWLDVNSPAGKLYFTEVSFGSAVTMNGGTNAIAQAQFDACQIFGDLTISGINVGVFKDNICHGNVNLNQHPNGGMATIFNVDGGKIVQTLTLTSAVDDFNRRCSAFLKSCYVENLVVDGVVSYADCDLVSQGKSSTVRQNGGQLIALTPKINHDLETQMLKPINNNAHNSGDWGKQWFFNFGYVHASAGTDLYLMSAMENYDPAGDTGGKSIFILPDGYGLQENVNGGNIELETAQVSGTGVRGKVQVKARELDMTSAKITNLADGVDPQDAVTKAQLDAISVGGGLTGKKESFTLSAADITNAYVDCAHVAAADTMLVMSGGVVHIEGESYTLSEVGGVTRITFIGDLVDPSPSQLVEGDKVHVQYLK